MNQILNRYIEQKKKYPKHVILFRIGDFYESFYDDAKIVSKALGLTLTSRGKGSDLIPMAGFPVHSAESYIARLIRQGFSAAIDDPAEKKAKGAI